MKKVILFFWIIFVTNSTMAASQNVLELPSTEKLVTLNPGDIKTFDVIIKNPFNYTLSGTTLNISGELGRWVAVVPNYIESIPANEKAKFTVIIIVPITASAGMYDTTFVLKSSTYESAPKQIIMNISKTTSSSTENTSMDLLSNELIKKFIFETFPEIIALFLGASVGAYVIDSHAKRRQLKKQIYYKINRVLDDLEEIKEEDAKVKISAIEERKNILSDYKENEFPKNPLYFEIEYKEIKKIIDLIIKDNYFEARKKMQKLKPIESRIADKLRQIFSVKSI